MHRDDMIRMARESCPYTSDEMRGAFYEGFIKGAAAEREACARACEEQKLKYEQRAEELEEFRDINPEVARIAAMTCDFNADAIRARGQQ